MSYSDLISLKDRVYIVTGGAGHLGHECCKAIANCGGRVYCLGRSQDKFKIFDEFLEENPSAFIRFIRADVTAEEDVEAAVAGIMKAENRIDGLFNNAASATRGINLEMTMHEWNMGVSNLLSHYFLFTRVVLREMEKSNRGVIINNASIWGIVSPNPDMYLDLKNEPPLYYPIAKAGVIQMTKYMAVLYAKKGIRINAITPGLFPQRRGPDRPDYMHEMQSRIPMGRIGQPSELAGAIVFLFSDLSSYIVGHNLIVDGGYTLY